MSITSNISTVALDASVILRFAGPAASFVLWSLPMGAGTITPLSDITDGNGNAWAVYNPNGFVGDVTIQVTYGT